MKMLLPVALILGAILIYMFFAAGAENDFQRRFGVTQYHHDRQREPQ